MRFSTNRIRFTALTAAAVACVTAISSARAAQWYTEPSLALTAGYEDNFRRTVANETSQNIFTAAPGIAFGTQTENTNVRTSATLRNYRYPGRDELNTTAGDLTANAGANYERFGFGLSARLSKTVLVAYENIDVDASRFADDSTSRAISASPTFRWSLGPRFDVSATASHTDVEYAGARADLYLDYRINAPSMTATYRYTERTSIFATVTDSRIEYTDIAVPTTVETLSESVGVTTQLSERLDASASVGSRRTTTESQIGVPTCVVFVGNFCAVPGSPRLVAIESIAVGSTYNANFSWRFETGSLAMSATRNIIPSGQATSVTANVLGATLTHALSPTVSATLSATHGEYRTDRNATVLDIGVNYDFDRIQPGLTWRIGETLTATLIYGSTRQHRIERDITTTNNSSYLTLSWNPTRRYISY